MEKPIVKKLMKKIKKHKTWTEGIFVNPISYRVNNNLYYMGGFQKGNEVVATAYVTLDGEEVREEAYEAQLMLSNFADISKNILFGGEERMKIDPAYFTGPLAVPLTTDQAQVKEGAEAFTKLWNVHQDYLQDFSAYKDYYEKDVMVREEITVDDVRKTQKTASKFNMYQYKTLKTLLEKNDDLKAYAAYIESTSTWKTMTNHQREFITGIISTKEQLKKSLDELNLIEHEDEEKMLQLNYEQTIKLNEEQMLSQQKYIRYPK